MRLSPPSRMLSLRVPSVTFSHYVSSKPAQDLAFSGSASSDAATYILPPPSFKQHQFIYPQSEYVLFGNLRTVAERPWLNGMTSESETNGAQQSRARRFLVRITSYLPVIMIPGVLRGIVLLRVGTFATTSDLHVRPVMTSRSLA